MFGAPKLGRFRSLASLILVVNVVGELQRKRTLAASRGFLAAARLSCINNREWPFTNGLTPNLTYLHTRDPIAIAWLASYRFWLMKWVLSLPLECCCSAHIKPTKVIFDLLLNINYFAIAFATNVSVAADRRVSPRTAVKIYVQSHFPFRVKVKSSSTAAVPQLVKPYQTLVIRLHIRPAAVANNAVSFTAARPTTADIFWKRLNL